MRCQVGVELLVRYVFKQDELAQAVEVQPDREDNEHKAALLRGGGCGEINRLT